jgi:hypothetical protein
MKTNWFGTKKYDTGRHIANVGRLEKIGDQLAI